MPEVMDAPASESAAPESQAIPNPTGDINPVASAFDALEKEYGLTPEPKPKKTVEKAVPEKKDPVTDAPDVVQDEPEATAEEPIPGAQTPKAKMKWGELRKKADEFDKIKPEHEKYRTDIEQLKTERQEEVARLTKELESIKQERDSEQGELYLTRVMATKEYKNSVIAPLKKLVDSAEQIAKDNDISHDTLMDLMYRGDRKALADAIAGFNDFDRQDVTRIFRDIQEVEGRRLELEANSKEAYKTSMASREAEYKGQMEAVAMQRVNEFKALKPQLQTFLEQLPEGERPDLAGVQQAVEAMHEMPEKLRVFAVAAGALYPKAIERLTEVLKEVEELRTENSSLRNGSPRADKGGTSTAPVVQGKDEAPKDSNELAADIMNRFRFGQG